MTREEKHEKVEFTVKCEMKKRWAEQFLSMLKYMQQLGSMGCSRNVTFYADGDGDFRPKFEWDVDIESDAKPISDNKGHRTYDAG